MHTDEFEISLTREYNVCVNQVNEIKNYISTLENKYQWTTQTFIENYKSNILQKDNIDFDSWYKKYNSLTKWEKNLKEYHELLKDMRLKRRS